MDTFAIIGCGEAAEVHAAQIAVRGSLAAVYDPVTQRASALGQRYNAALFHSVEELLAQPGIQTVCVCSPTGFHAEHIIKALQAGKHVICESTLCITKAAAWQIIETQKFSRRRLFVMADKWSTGSTTLVDGDFTLQCEAAADSSKAWQGERFPGGGPLYTHFSGAVRFLIERFGPVVSAQASLDETNKTETNGEAWLKMQDGSKGKISWSLTADRPSCVLRIAGQEQQLQSSRTADLSMQWDRWGDTFRGIEYSNAELIREAAAVEAIEKIYNSVIPQGQ